MPDTRFYSSKISKHPIKVTCNMKPNETHNWVIVCAAPQPPEKAVKIITAVIYVALRPTKSLIFAQITRPTIRYMCIREGNLAIKIVSIAGWALTNVGDQICVD